jgi:hypothetical protein
VLGGDLREVPGRSQGANADTVESFHVPEDDGQPGVGQPAVHRLGHPRLGCGVFASSLAHNPHADRGEYIGCLAHLLPAPRARLVHGDWDITEEVARLFTQGSFRVVPPHKVDLPTTVVPYWDLVATEPSAPNLDPDWTVGLRRERDRQGA